MGCIFFAEARSVGNKAIYSRRRRSKNFCAKSQCCHGNSNAATKQLPEAPLLASGLVVIHGGLWLVGKIQSSQ